MLEVPTLVLVVVTNDAITLVFLHNLLIVVLMRL